MSLIDIEIKDVILTVSGEVIWRKKTTWNEPGHPTYVSNFCVCLDVDCSTMDITDSIGPFTRESLEEKLIEEARHQEEMAKAQWEDEQNERWREERKR